MEDIQFLQPAMQVFWQNGYEGTNFHQLVEATGLSRKSIYKKWHDKSGLFTQCLTLYSQIMTEQNLAPLLAADSTGLPAVKGFFKMFENYLQADGPMLGCLVVKTVSELGTQDAEINKISFEFLGNVKAGLNHSLQTASKKGQLKPAADIAQAVEFLFAVHCSIGGLASNQLTHPLLLSMVNQVENCLDLLAA